MVDVREDVLRPPHGTTPAKTVYTFLEILYQDYFPLIIYPTCHSELLSQFREFDLRCNMLDFMMT